MNIRIVGGGWYGCHIARKLAEREHEVHLFEKGSRLFSGASGNNQSRLHLGFHYPRDEVTRHGAYNESIHFLREYGLFTRPVRTNIYAVAEDVSLVDYGTYKEVMPAQYIDLQPKDFGLTYVQGAMLTGERVILQGAAARYFDVQFRTSTYVNMFLDTEIADLEPNDYDWTIDCTFGTFDIHDVEWYEPCCMALYEDTRERDLALTVMDGPAGVSLYPYYIEGLVSLTSVAETPLRRCESMYEARMVIDQFLKKEVWQEQIRTKMEERILRYFPSFDGGYVQADPGWATAVRVKPVSGSDRRSVVITPQEDRRVITVFPGKITGIFDAWEQVEEIIG